MNHIDLPIDLRYILAEHLNTVDISSIYQTPGLKGWHPNSNPEGCDAHHWRYDPIIGTIQRYAFRMDAYRYRPKGGVRKKGKTGSLI